MARNDRWLLPDGIEEILPREARRLERLRREVLDLFAAWGYELVMPPLIEYLDALLTGVGQELDLQTFKLTDQLTGRLMGVRADITPQAARIDAHYLRREAPTRLCYLGSVLRTRPDEFAGSREPLQLGAELFGSRAPEADAEVISLMIETLKRAGVGAPHLDLGHVGIFRALAAHAGLAPAQEAELFGALQRKAKSAVDAQLATFDVNSEVKQMLAALLELSGGAATLDAARGQLRAGPPGVMKAVDELAAVADRVRAQVAGVELHFDLAELSGYHYYTGVVFSAFVAGHGRALAKGGRYDGIGRAFGRERAATGFGADLRELLRFAPNATAPPGGILAPAAGDTDLQAEIARLRAAGERVVRELPQSESAPAALGCDRRLIKKGKAWSIENV